MRKLQSKGAAAMDMTEGTAWKMILTFSFPLVFGNLFQQLYSIVDAVVVGKFVGVDALAAVGAWEAPVFDLARQFRGADAVVVAAPFWDLSFPAALRTYIEYISANGLTYHYESDGCHGDCRAHRLVYLTSGGDVEREDSVGVLYWRQLCAMFGIARFDYVFAGGLDLDPAKTPALVDAAADLARKLGGED